MDMFSKPKVPKPTPMPDDAELTKARLRKTADIQQRSGRDSTILSDTFGG
jgi:hypothetical protein